MLGAADSAQAGCTTEAAPYDPPAIVLGEGNSRARLLLGNAQAPCRDQPVHSDSAGPLSHIGAPGEQIHTTTYPLTPRGHDHARRHPGDLSH